MKHKLEIARKVMRYIYNYLLVLFFATFALYIIRRGNLGISEAVILAGAMGISWILRNRSGNNIVLFLVHTVMIVGVVFIEKGVVLKTVMGVTLFMVMIFAMRYNRRGGTLRMLDEVPWPMFLSGMLMYVFGMYMNNKAMVFEAYLIPVFLFITYLIIVYLDGMYYYIDRTKDIEDLPVKRMMSVNSVIVAGIILVIIVAIAITYLFNFDGLMKGFFKGVITIFGFIILGFKFIYALLFSFLKGGESAQDDVANKREEAAKLMEDNGFADSLTTIVIVALVILAALLIFYIVKKIVRFIILKRRMPQDIIENITEIAHDQKEKRKTFSQVMKERMSMDEKVRRVYRKTVLQAGRPYVPAENETTLDINTKVSVNSKYDLSDMTELYNELRYGQILPDRKTYFEMKKRARHIDAARHPETEKQVSEISGQ
ncbi:MAG: hypothetical protein IJJ74_08005 [Eubacterium sp.]|nr:hypothetical protein [Eubacterium sp.]